MNLHKDSMNGQTANGQTANGQAAPDLLDRLQALQNELHDARERTIDDDSSPLFWRYLAAAEAVRVAWYIANQETGVEAIGSKVELFGGRWRELERLLKRQTYKVYYAKNPHFGRRHFGIRGDEPELTLSDLPETHVFVKEVQAESLGQVFHLMQGEIWSPGGEARPLIKRLGLHHTSMSVGDVAQAGDGTYYECMIQGWREIKEGQK